MKFKFKHIEPPPWVTSDQWDDWKWQFKNSLTSLADFNRYFDLSPEEQEGFAGNNRLFKIRTTPYYAHLADSGSAADPIRKLLVPHKKELEQGRQQMLDPLGEQQNTPAPRIIHRYPDRVLLLVTDQCSVYCRYCTRKHFTGKDQAFIKNSDYQQALDYIRSHTGIREVILSGGDPLSLSDSRLDQVLSDVRSIEHIEIIRVGTRMPVVCPMRVTEELVGTIRRYAPVYLMTHFNHPRELTAQAAQALGRFVDNGIPVFNQMVLLNGVNNHAAIVQALSRRLLYLRAKPYYMFQCDPSLGTDHLRTSIENSEQIQRELWGRLSGLAMPNLSLDIPEGGGKIGLVPNFEVHRTKGQRTYRGWDGIESDYINPDSTVVIEPSDISEYMDELVSLNAEYR